MNRPRHRYRQPQQVDAKQAAQLVATEEPRVEEAEAPVDHPPSVEASPTVVDAEAGVGSDCQKRVASTAQSSLADTRRTVTVR